MDWKSFLVNIGFAIVGLGLTMGLVGLAVYSSYWYSLVNQPIWVELVGKSWKNIGVTTTTFLTLAIIIAVLSFSFDYTIHFLITSAILQIPAFVLVIVILSKSSSKSFNKCLKDFKEKGKTLKSWENFSLAAGCKYFHDEDPTCTEDSQINRCCDGRVEYFVNNRTKDAYRWFLAFFLTWILSIVLLVPLCIFFCDKSSKNTGTVAE